MFFTAPLRQLLMLCGCVLARPSQKFLLWFRRVLGRLPLSPALWLGVLCSTVCPRLDRSSLDACLYVAYVYDRVYAHVYMCAIVSICMCMNLPKYSNVGSLFFAQNMFLSCSKLQQTYVRFEHMLVVF